MGEDKFVMFGNRLTRVYRHFSRQAARQKVSCYRIFDQDLPEFPLCIELYGELVYLAEYKRHHGMSENEHEDWLDRSIEVISEVLELPEENIYVRQRQRKAGRQGQYEKLNSEQHFFMVEEGGLRFRVNLTDYLDTGLFLDHRITRSMVRQESEGKQVLNLFCYTGSFSVYAAAGGASAVHSVDLSKTYLSWAEENLHLNGILDRSRYLFIHADVKQYLDDLPAEKFDLVVMDPPTFSNSKRMRDFLDIQQDHVELINKTLRAMKEGGVLYFSTNFRKFRLDQVLIKSNSIRDITKSTTPFDFQGKLARYCFRIIKD